MGTTEQKRIEHPVKVLGTLLGAAVIFIVCAGLATPVRAQVRHRAGDPIRLTKVGVSTLYPGVKIFSLLYWSRGREVQGYLDVPPERTPLPLVVSLHGGYLTSRAHYNGYPAVTKQGAIEAAEQGNVVFLPNYGGYGESPGTVGTPYDDFLDVRNGLRALDRLHKFRIQPHATYLLGASTGGFVALKLAEADNQVKAIALLSPWPGFTLFREWVQAAKSVDPDDQGDMQLLTTTYGTNTASAAYTHNSLLLDEIHSPVLIIGGTSDAIIPPDLLLDLYSGLRAHNPNVTLKFVKGGHAPATSQEQQLMYDWLSSQGLY